MAVDDWVAALRTADAVHKDALIRRLGEARDPAAIPALSALVRDPAERIDLRRLAARALGDIGDSRGCMALIAVLNEPARPNRGLIPRLKELQAQVEQQLGQADLSDSQMAALQKKQAEIAATIVHDGDVVRLLKIDAVQALGNIGYVLALKPLEDILKTGNDPDLAAAAESALAQVREKSGLKAEDDAPAEPEPEAPFVLHEVLTCARCGVTSETNDVQRCRNCRLPVCETHSLRESELVFCSTTCRDSFASLPGNWEYFV